MALSAALLTLSLFALVQYTTKTTGDTKKNETQVVEDQLGPWLSTGKDTKSSWRKTSPAFLGPKITARLADKFCGINEVHLCRLPHGEMGSACWSILLATIQPKVVSTNSPPNAPVAWSQIPLNPLVKLESELCIKISRPTLMTLFALTNARLIYKYSSAAGHRSAYPSYCGQWTISWPIGKPCVVRLAPHDSHNAATDVYPPSFPVRIDKCVEMMAGIISDGQWKVAFPGRANHAGPWVLQERPNGFGGAHGSRHLYNMQGGKVFEVDLLALVRFDETMHKPIPGLRLEVPCLGEKSDQAKLLIPEDESRILARALNCLPWSSLSWSLHRGLKDVLLAYGKPTMNQYREQLALLLKAETLTNRVALIKKGWAPEIVDGAMASMAESAILSGAGNSGDVVRIVVAIVECLLEKSGLEKKINLDKTEFWSQQQQESSDPRLAAFFAGGNLSVGDLDMVVALIKFFVLEWSQELDYQLYHDLPVQILLS
ncbi:hypothetical protein BDZ45DRAFT_600573 [Acephala macrosclerotiorum]|nr:hypothetical protein BDZ45DRAFT_600573 [Acephala macrosclerotiorum]